jgi:hypothetical protein
MHLVAHCGLGIGLAAGKCCAERISEQGEDFVHEGIGDVVLVKTVSKSALRIPKHVRFIRGGSTTLLKLEQSTTLLKLNQSG